ncbi:IS3 family transposase [Streptomyces sp. AC627_RSS907]|uniref:IS3 family transposase n=1 Tax=Streptomyces sp. AC627_RSS907 TaxID=2823684 RepID=UPI0027E4CF0F|nr:IS3 family transposase [Streptomyces sp. AC627_RSS907]
MIALVDEHPHLGVEPVLRELNIASSTYYRWRQAEKEPRARRRQDAELTEKIRQVHADSDGIYGSPRVRAVLKREGVHVNRKRVERLTAPGQPDRDQPSPEQGLHSPGPGRRSGP